MTFLAVPSRHDVPVPFRSKNAPRGALLRRPSSPPVDLADAYERLRRARRVHFVVGAGPPNAARAMDICGAPRPLDAEAALGRAHYEFVRAKPHGCVSRPVAVVGCIAGLAVGYGVGVARTNELTTSIGFAAVGTWACALLLMLATWPSYHRGHRLPPQ